MKFKPGDLVKCTEESFGSNFEVGKVLRLINEDDYIVGVIKGNPCFKHDGIWGKTTKDFPNTSDEKSFSENHLCLFCAGDNLELIQEGNMVKKAHKYKVGDIVRSKIDEIDSAVILRFINEKVLLGVNYPKNFLGHSGAQAGKDFPSNPTEERYSNSQLCWWVNVDDLEFVNLDETSIIIKRFGNSIIARTTSVNIEGVATCSPEDKFDFYLGAQIALARLARKVGSKVAVPVGKDVEFFKL